MRFKIVFVFLLLCIMPTLAQDATPGASDCNTMPRPKKREHFAILNFGDQVLGIEAWRVYLVYDIPQQSAIAWTNDNVSLIYISHFIYECGFPGTAMLRASLNIAYFQSIFTRFSLEPEYETCQAGNLLLSELKTNSDNGIPFRIRVWHEPLDLYHMREVRMVMQKTRKVEMDALSAKFYPDLPSCAEDP